MGAFVVVIVTLLTAIWLALAPYGQDAQQVNPNPSRAAVQAIAANMIQFHQAAVNFVSMAANKAPTSTRWGFTYLSQKAVRCSPYSGFTYPANSVSGTCPATAFPMPTFMSDTAAAYDWVVCYDSTAKVVVTYSRTGENPGGYTPAEVSAALSDYSISGNYSGWFWGVTTKPAALVILTEPSNVTLPTTCTASPTSAVAAGVIAIATSIP